MVVPAGAGGFGGGGGNFSSCSGKRGSGRRGGGVVGATGSVSASAPTGAGLGATASETEATGATSASMTGVVVAIGALAASTAGSAAGGVPEVGVTVALPRRVVFGVVVEGVFLGRAITMVADGFLISCKANPPDCFHSRIPRRKRRNRLPIRTRVVEQLPIVRPADWSRGCGQRVQNCLRRRGCQAPSISNRQFSSQRARPVENDLPHRMDAPNRMMPHPCCLRSGRLSCGSSRNNRLQARISRTAGAITVHGVHRVAVTTSS